MPPTSSPLAHLVAATVGQLDPAPKTHRSMLRAANDAEAIAVWVETKRETSCSLSAPSAGRAAAPAHTARAYEREAHRFALWLRETRGLALADATIEDCLSYKTFLADPQPSGLWCGPRSGRRGTPEWRPFAGPLQAPARRQALTILSNLYKFLQDHRYLSGNPWSGVPMPRGSTPRVDARRSLNRAQWTSVLDALHCLPRNHASVQLSWLVRLLYCSGLRLAEIASATCSDLTWFDLANDDAGASPTCGAWVIRIVGKGMKIREVPIPTDLVEGFAELQALRGWSTHLQACADRPLLMSNSGSQLSAQALYRQVKRFFTGVALRLRGQGRPADADVFLRASTHWLRHTHGTHSVAAGVPLDVVQQNLGHASLSTTTVYVRADLRRRVAETKRLGSP